MICSLHNSTSVLPQYMHRPTGCIFTKVIVSSESKPDKEITQWFFSPS